MLEMVCYFLFSLVEFLFCCLFLRLGLEVVRVCLTTATAGTLRCAIDLLLLLCLGQESRGARVAAVSALLCTRPWMRALQKAAEASLWHQGADPDRHDTTIVEKIVVICEHIAKHEGKA